MDATRIRILPLLLLALACGDDGADGGDGGGCRLDGESLRCEDGSATELELPPGCEVATLDGGGHELRCPDETIELHDGGPLPRGSIAGSVGRFGLPQEAGIVAALPALDLSSSTDGEGRFLLESIPPGVWDLRLEYDGWPALEIPGVVVLGGAVEVGMHSLRYAAPIAEDAEYALVSPGERLLLARGAGAMRELHLADLEAGGVRSLAGQASDCAFFDDRYLLCVLPSLFGDESFVYDADEGTRIPIGSYPGGYHRVEGGLIAFDAGGANLVRIPSGEATPLHAWIVALSERTVIVEDAAVAGRVGVLDVSAGAIEWLDAPMVGEHAFSRRSGAFAFVTVRDGNRWLALHTPGEGTRLLDLVGSVRLVIGRRADDRLAIWDVESEREVLLPATTDVLVAWIGQEERAFVRGASWLAVFDVDELPQDASDLERIHIVEYAFSTEGSVAAFIDAEREELGLLDLEDGAVKPLGIRATTLALAPDGSALLTGIGGWVEHVIDVETGVRRPIAAADPGAITFHPGGFLTQRSELGVDRWSWGLR